MHAVAIGIGIMVFGLGAAGTSAGGRDVGRGRPGPAAGGRRRVDPARPRLLLPERPAPGGLDPARRGRPIRPPGGDPQPGQRAGAEARPQLRRRPGRAAPVGARILAYVDSDYGRRPLADVEKDLRTYPTFYRIDGYFIDQMANRPEAVDHYRSIRQRIRQIDPLLRVVANPGTYTRPEYLDTADTLVTFEGSARDFAGYNPQAAMPWIAGHPPRRFAAMVYDVRDAAAGREALSRATRSGAGSVYITDQKMPNPYLGLPPYWADQVAAVRAMNEPRKPAEAPPSRP